jgi:3',5'-cyclic AMP phosphodiesterase CpdA
MKIAHFSDLHLLDLTGVPVKRFLNKRLTGWANLRLKRGNIHRARYVTAIAREIARSGVDHTVITGDLTNLSLEREFELVRCVLEDELGIDPDRVTIVPGNHDLYTRGALESRRFGRFIAPWLKSDLPGLAVDVGGARFPVVKLRGPAAFVALSSAVPRPPFVAAGELGEPQLAALRDVLAHPEVAGRVPVIAIHHPPVHPWSRLKAHSDGLRDSKALLGVLGSVGRGIVLHGHLHRRIQRELFTALGRLQQIGATSASLHHADPDRMAGYNLYELDDAGGSGHARVEAMVYDPEADAFRVLDVPKHVGWAGDHVS